MPDERIVTVIGPDAGVAPGYMPESQWKDMCRAYEHELRPDQWTTTPPTEPGWYWAWMRGASNPMIVWKYKQKTLVYSGLQTLPAARFTHWLGPLLVPEHPDA